MEKLLTIEQITEMLQVKKSTVYSLVHRRQIPFVKLTGKLLRFRQREIQEWLDSRNSINVHLASIRKNPKSTKSKEKKPSNGNYLSNLIHKVKEEVLREI